MAQRTVVSLVDDLDGSEAEETVSFGVHGVMYEIDLSEANATKLRDALASYVAHARRTGGRRRPVAGSGRSSLGSSRAVGRAPVDREQNQAMREWARRQGLEVSARGRLPHDIVEAFHRAH